MSSSNQIPECSCRSRVTIADSTTRCRAETALLYDGRKKKIALTTSCYVINSRHERGAARREREAGAYVYRSNKITGEHQ